MTARIDYDAERLEARARLTVRNGSGDPVTEIPLLFATLGTRTAGADVRRLFDDWLYTTRWLDMIRGGATYVQLLDGYRPR